MGHFWCRLYLLVVAVLAATHKETLKEWLKSGKHPEHLSQSLKLASMADDLLSQLNGQKIALVLPSNAAWKKDPKLYKKISEDPGLVRTLLMQAAIFVDPAPKNLKALASQAKANGDDYLETVGGEVFVVFKGDSAYMGTMDDNGVVKRKKEKLPIDNGKIEILADATIFTLKKLVLPDDFRSLREVAMPPANINAVAV